MPVQSLYHFRLESHLRSVYNQNFSPFHFVFCISYIFGYNGKKIKFLVQNFPKGTANQCCCLKKFLPFLKSHTKKHNDTEMTRYKVWFKSHENTRHSQKHLDYLYRFSFQFYVYIRWYYFCIYVIYATTTTTKK